MIPSSIVWFWFVGESCALKYSSTEVKLLALVFEALHFLHNSTSLGELPHLLQKHMVSEQLLNNTNLCSFVLGFETGSVEAQVAL